MISIRPLGEAAFIVRWPEVSLRCHRQLMNFTYYLQQHSPLVPGLVCIPSYQSVTVHFSLWQHDVEQVYQLLVQALAYVSEHSGKLAKPRSFSIPCCYDPRLAMDLSYVLESKQCSAKQLQALHSVAKYRVYALGFSPGFAYLGNVAKALQMPRKRHPSPRVAAGSVAIAERQTAVYPTASPGGWQVIGRTPQPMLVEQAGIAMPLLQVGDSVRFVPITLPQFVDLGGKVDV